MKHIKYWMQVFLLPIYWFSFITIRSKRIYLFGSSFGKRFADNSKYLYLYASQHKKDVIHPIWITHKKEIAKMLTENGYEAYYYKSVKGMWYCLRARYYIFDNYSKDISFWLSGGAKKINLWHGTGNKKINYDNKFDEVRHPKNNWDRLRFALRRMSDEKPSHYILATSEMMGDIFASAFRVPRNHIIVDGYPRNDVLFKDCKIRQLYTEEEKEVISTLKELKDDNYKILLYMPTFRDSETKFFDVMDLKSFNEFLYDNRLIFLTKLHPKSKLKLEFERIKLSNIINASADVDPYTILEFADVLTTDYSSVYTDFLLLNRPSVLFTYDLEEYSRDTRECYFDYDDYIPELRTYTMEEFQEGILRVLKKDEFEEGRIELRSKMFAYVDSGSCERILGKIENI
ncbi:MAG TPA: hypothetical protein GXZ21_11835 [Clostridiales bacterium]|jgi:CDP-glycerol glycerophosphotransferase (TagB/SpsB family)|nr:hypothetical protein [Clostridiales bacterium]